VSSHGAIIHAAERGRWARVAPNAEFEIRGRSG
jgi:hypothetical protein